jgi:hypothetical protein
MVDDLNWTGTFVDPDNYLAEVPEPIDAGSCSNMQVKQYIV